MTHKGAFFAIFISFLSSITVCYCVSTMSIDLGSSITKIAVVSPGIPMEIALDSESNRLIPTLVLLKEGNRLFGNAAVAGAIKNPKLAFAELPSIVGKTIKHPSVILYKQRFPHHNLTFNEITGQLIFSLNEKQYTAEELLAMFLENARKIAEKFSNSSMKTAVITVHSHATQADRKAILRSAQLAGIEVIQLMNANAAIALNFGLSQQNSLKNKPQFLFYDVGLSATTASVVSLQMAKIRVGDQYEEHPHAFIRGIGSDSNLGTNVFVDRLLVHLVDRFQSKRKHSTTDVTKNPKALAKLRMEATRVFRILSANKEINSAVDNVMDGEDFRLKVTRDELEEMCKDLSDRFKTVIYNALEMAGIQMHELEDVIIFGGGTRIPMVQKIITETTKKSNIGKGINADEAAALGLVYQAAVHTPGFRVKLFFVKDITRFPIAVTFKRNPKETEEEPITENIYTTRVLFNFGNPYPQKRTITFNRPSPDMNFLVHYGEMDPSMTKYLNGVKNLFNVSVTDVLIQANNYPDYVFKGVKAHFNMDESGVLSLTGVNLIMKPHNETVVANATQDGSAFQNSFAKKVEIADGISNLFKTSTEETPVESINEAVKEPVEMPDNTTSPIVNTTDSLADANLTAQVTKPTFVQPLSFKVTTLDGTVPMAEHMNASKLVLIELEKQDEDKRELDRTRNLLETTIYENRAKLEVATFVKHTTLEERESLSNVITSVNYWYDDEGYVATKSDLDEQLEKINNVTAPLKKRVQDYAQVVILIKEMSEMLNATESVLMMMKSLQSSLPKPPVKPVTVEPEKSSETSTDKEKKETQELEKLMTVFTDTEINLVKITIEENKKWLEKVNETLKSTDSSMDLPVKFDEIVERTLKMHQDSGYYMRKAENWKAAMRRAEAEFKRRAAANKTKTEESTSKPINESVNLEESLNASTSVETQEPASETADETTIPREEL